MTCFATGSSSKTCMNHIIIFPLSDFFNSLSLPLPCPVISNYQYIYHECMVQSDTCIPATLNERVIEYFTCDFASSLSLECSCPFFFLCQIPAHLSRLTSIVVLWKPSGHITSAYLHCVWTLDTSYHNYEGKTLAPTPTPVLLPINILLISWARYLGSSIVRDNI